MASVLQPLTLLPPNIAVTSMESRSTSEGPSTAGSASVGVIDPVMEVDPFVRQSDFHSLRCTVETMVDVVEGLQLKLAQSLSLISQLSGRLGSAPEDEALKVESKRLEVLLNSFHKEREGIEIDDSSSFCPQALVKSPKPEADENICENSVESFCPQALIKPLSQQPLVKPPVAPGPSRSRNNLSNYGQVSGACSPRTEQQLLSSPCPKNEPASSPMMHYRALGNNGSPRPEPPISSPMMPTRTLGGSCQSPGPARTPHPPGSAPHPQNRCPMSPALQHRPLSPMRSADPVLRVAPPVDSSKKQPQYRQSPFGKESA